MKNVNDWTLPTHNITNKYDQAQIENIEIIAKGSRSILVM